MNTVAELKQIMNKETWTQEDCLRIRGTIANAKEPVKKFRSAVADLETNNPTPSGAAAVKLGIAYYMLCRFDEAVELLSKGTDNKERRFYQALCYKHLRQWDNALETLGLAEDRGWNPKEVTLETAEVQCLSGDAATAKRTIERFAKSSQEDANFHHVTGMIAEMQGDYDTAIQSYEKSREIQPKHQAATFRMAYYYDLHGDTDAAIELYLECVSKTETAKDESVKSLPQPVHANALLNLAVLYEDAGQYEKAKHCLRRILTCNPNHPRAKLFLKDINASKTMVFDEDEAKRRARRNDLLAIPVTDFELSVRARNCLKKMNIRTLGNLLNVTEAELLSYKNFGETSLAEIKTMLAMKNLTIGQMRETEATEETDQNDTGPTVGDEGVLAMPLAQIELSVRVRKVLERLKVKTLGELAAKTEPELVSCQNFGKTSIDEVKLRLKDYGLSLREIS